MRTHLSALFILLIGISTLISSGCSDSSDAMSHLVMGQEYLAENASKEGVTVTESGLQYKVLVSASEDAQSPSVEDTVAVHYKGTLIDGTVFDSSLNRDPAVFPLKGVISGWTEALQLMKVGDIFELTLPYDLAYGSRGKGSIPAYAVLIFEVELISIKP